MQELRSASAYANLLRQGYGGQEASSGQARSEAIKELQNADCKNLIKESRNGGMDELGFTIV